MSKGLENQCRPASRVARCEPLPPGLIRETAERHHRLDRARIKDCLDPLIAILRNRFILDLASTPALPKHAVEERVDQDVAARESKTLQKPVNALARRAHKNPP